MLAEKLKKWQHQSLNAAVQLWKKVTIYIAQQEEASQLDLEQRGAALRLVGKTLDRRLQSTLSRAWKGWKYQVQSAMKADLVRVRKDAQLTRVIKKLR